MESRYIIQWHVMLIVWVILLASDMAVAQTTNTINQTTITTPDPSTTTTKDPPANNTKDHTTTTTPNPTTTTAPNPTATETNSPTQPTTKTPTSSSATTGNGDTNQTQTANSTTTTQTQTTPSTVSSIPTVVGKSTATEAQTSTPAGSTPNASLPILPSSSSLTPSTAATATTTTRAPGDSSPPTSDANDTTTTEASTNTTAVSNPITSLPPSPSSTPATPPAVTVTTTTHTPGDSSTTTSDTTETTTTEASTNTPAVSNPITSLPPSPSSTPSTPPAATVTTTTTTPGDSSTPTSDTTETTTTVPTTTATDNPASGNITSTTSDTTVTTTTAANHCNPNPCVNGTCINLGNDYNCTCVPGFTNKNCSKDIDECNTTSPCSPNATCTNTVGSYTCMCKTGFTGNGTVCTDINECNTTSSCSPNATCSNTVGSYTCTCKKGFTGNGTVCTDIDECNTTSSCSPNATCTNTVGSYTCTCKKGFTGNGTVCTDIDECNTTSSCSPNATCTNTVGSYTCTCKKGFTGNGTVCTDINECNTTSPCSPNATCTNTVGSYTCKCKEGFTGNGTVCTDIDDCENVTCKNDGMCKDHVNNYTCSCTQWWEGAHCEIDIDECERHTYECHPKAYCNNTEGDYNCTCMSGYHGSGKHCQDINECANETTNNCSENGTSFCRNINGDYKCVCKDGWTGIYCDNDIDECAEKSTCSDHANCTNNDGGYECKCQTGYRGNGTTSCIREVLFNLPSGKEHQGDDNNFGPFPVPGGLPYYNNMYYSFYVNMNGYITLGRRFTSRYPPETSKKWASTETPIIAPLWTDIETGGDSKLVINANINTTLMEEMLSDSNQTLENPRFGFAATWKKAVPYPYEQNAENEVADFQAVLLTNGSNTLIIFNYDQEIFTWDNVGKAVSIGYSGTSLDGEILFLQSNFTKANSGTNDGLNGRWVYSVSEDNDEALVTEAQCQAWIDDVSLQDKLQQAISNSEPCPCSLDQAFRDSRFRYSGYHGHDNKYVFDARFPRWPHMNKQKCHYDNVFGGLVVGYPEGGYLETLDTILKINEAFDDCCVTSKRLCSLFYQTNISDSCRHYRPPAWGPSWGDPHITTLDGKEYTFNGRGEYILLKSDNLTVQVRTELAKEDSYDATVFVGIAAQERNGDNVEIILNTTSHICNIYLNGVTNSPFPDEHFMDIDADKVSVYKSNTNNDSLVIAFQSGISLQVTVSDILDLVTSVPQKNRSIEVSGLLGNFDGNPLNDFILRNKTELLPNSSEGQLFEFGASWNINSTESLFKYHTSHDYSFYNNRTIQPAEFIGDIANLTDYLVRHCKSSLNNDTIHAGCNSNRACIIDAAATCNISFGERSKGTQELVKEERKIVDNKPPVFNNSDAWMVEPDSDGIVHLQLVVSDTDPMFTVSVNTNITESSYSFNQTTKEFTWNVTEDLQTSEVYLKFIATDNMNATSIYWPSIYYCGCKQTSECDYAGIQDTTSSPNLFYRARCNCTENTTGQYCTGDVCDPSPCFPGVACNSSNSMSLCGQCPEGYTGTDGMKCYDANECYLGTDQCQQICNSTVGSYNCSCFQGYTLNKDNHHCDDIDECADLAINNCSLNQYCHNLNGSFTCGCMPGFIDVYGNNTCEKVKLSFVLSLVIYVHGTPSNQTIKDDIKKWLKDDVFSIKFISIDVYLTAVNSRSRKRRTVNSDKAKATAILHSDSTSLTTKDVKDAFNAYKILKAVNGKITPNDTTFDVFNSSDVLGDEDSPLCEFQGASQCDPLSTHCLVLNAKTVCECKPGFHQWNIPGQSCKDDNECSTDVSDVCVGGNCTNLPGTYECHCKPGYQYDGSSNCQDLCLTNPCQNGGSCIHGDKEAQYICKCDDNWAGANCERENEETARLKTIAIVVGSVIGGVCLLLLVALFGVYRRSVSRKNAYGRYMTSGSTFDDDYSIPRANLIREKDTPFDDQNTTFSIPRPRLTHIEHEMTDLDAHSENSDRDGYGKDDLKDDAKQPLAAASKPEMKGKENPSFLHDESTANLRKSKTGSKSNPYEYF